MASTPEQWHIPRRVVLFSQEAEVEMGEKWMKTELYCASMSLGFQNIDWRYLFLVLTHDSCLTFYNWTTPLGLYHFFHCGRLCRLLVWHRFCHKTTLMITQHLFYYNTILVCGWTKLIFFCVSLATDCCRQKTWLASPVDPSTSVPENVGSSGHVLGHEGCLRPLLWLAALLSQPQPV